MKLDKFCRATRLWHRSNLNAELPAVPKKIYNLFVNVFFLVGLRFRREYMALVNLDFGTSLARHLNQSCVSGKVDRY